MENMVKQIENLIDPAWVKEHLINLYRLERPQTFAACHAAADYVCTLLRQEGFVYECLETPADGVTVYQDKQCQIGWDVEHATLRVLSPVPGLDDPVIADYAAEPLSIVRHSVGTPPEGITTRLVTEEQMKAGADVTGALVLLNRDTYPRWEPLKMLLELGAIGWVSDFLEKPLETPDGVQWVNACEQNNSWHTQGEDPDHLGFQITPRAGLALRSACEKGEVLVHAVSDARRHVTDLTTVTTTLPGEDPREIWLLAHLYEPLLDDNTNGVIGVIAIMKALRTMVEQGKLRLKYTIRAAFGSEMYGFAPLAEHFGGDLSQRTIGALDADALMSSRDKSEHFKFWVREAPDLPGFAGNLLAREAARQFQAVYPQAEFLYTDHSCSDDCFLGDSTVGLPTVVLGHGPVGYHHNSVQDETMLDLENTIHHLGLWGAWIRAMAALTEEEVEAFLPTALEMAQKTLAEAAEQPVRPNTDCRARMAFIYERECSKIRNLGLWGRAEVIEKALEELKMPELPASAVSSADQSWYAYTENFVFSRLTRGFPHDLVQAPFACREKMPGTISADPIADLLSRMDGERSLRTLIDLLEWDRGCILDEATVRSYLHTCIMLAEFGYLGMEQKDVPTASELAAAIRAVGVQAGDTVLVVSDLEGFSLHYGETVIEALQCAVGEHGTFLAPAFAQSYIYAEGQISRTYDFRPYDTRPDGALRDKTLCWHDLAMTMAGKAGACRSGHPTHEWIALGADAEAMVSAHGFTDAPAGETSPMAKALKKGGKLLFLGCDTGYNPAVYLAGRKKEDAVIRYINADGKLKTVMIPDWFRVGFEACGAPVREQSFGVNGIRCMDLADI